MNKVILAFDLGAESGRLVAGYIENDTLKIEEIYRFPDKYVYVSNHLFWDILSIFSSMKQGLLKFKSLYKKTIASMGIDTWGVDFGFINKYGNLIENPYHYRDRRTDGIMDEVFEIIPKREIFFKTGIQFMQINTIYQLYSVMKNNKPLIDIIDKMLLIPNLLTYFFTGKKSAEFTISSTTQFYDYQNKDWHWDIINTLGFPRHIFPEIRPSGSSEGNISPFITKELEISPFSVIVPGTHDTASAVASVPAGDKNWAYLSSGTWSLMGVEVDTPIINEKTYRYNFTNEGGVLGNIRLLKNIMGLWLMQGVKRSTAKKGEEKSYEELTILAENTTPFSGIIDPDDPIFFNPPDMVEAVKEYLKKTGQKIPKDIGTITRIILESLALKYRYVFELLEDIIGKELEVLHIVGGGTKNKLLSHFTADALGKEVIAGPIEATTIGNILVQAISLGKIKNLKEGREMVEKSFPLEKFYPGKNRDIWDEKFLQFKKITKLEV